MKQNETEDSMLERSRHVTNKLVERAINVIRSKMKGQDHMITSDPIYVVQDRRRIMGMDTTLTNQITWLYECEEVTDPEDEDLKAAIAHFEEYGKEPHGWDRTGYIDVWQDVQPFFSLKGAEEYIKVRSRHLKHPRVFVKSGFDNPEWKAIRAFLTQEEES